MIDVYSSHTDHRLEAHGRDVPVFPQQRRPCPVTKLHARVSANLQQESQSRSHVWPAEHPQFPTEEPLRLLRTASPEGKTCPSPSSATWTTTRPPIALPIPGSVQAVLDGTSED